MSNSPQAVILVIGNELVSGTSVDTNGRFAAQVLSACGVGIRGISLVRDDVNALSRAIKKALIEVEIVLLSGGLGPTLDDITREAVALSVGRTLEFQQDLMDTLEERFAARGRSMSESNRRQAFLPQGAVAVPNAQGTAPGLMLQRGNRTIFALPGVPFEFCHMLEHEVVPLVSGSYAETLKPRVSRTVLITGASESSVGEAVSQWMQPGVQPELGITAKMGAITLRAVALDSPDAPAHEALDTLEKNLREALKEDVCLGAPATPEDALAALSCLEKVAVVDGVGGGSLSARLRSAGIQVSGWIGDREFLLQRFSDLTSDFGAVEAAAIAATQSNTEAGVAILEGDGGFLFVAAVFRDQAYEAVVVPDDNPEINRWRSEARVMDLLRRLAQGLPQSAESLELAALAELGVEVTKVEEQVGDEVLKDLDSLNPPD